MSETTQTAIYYNGNWYGRSGNTDALDSRITQTANNIAPRQISDTASKLITVGEYFTDKSGRLCVCDVQIASGGSIVVGSNCHVVSEGIGNELNGKLIAEVTSDGSKTYTQILNELYTIAGISVFDDSYYIEFYYASNNIQIHTFGSYLVGINEFSTLIMNDSGTIHLEVAGLMPSNSMYRVINITSSGSIEYRNNDLATLGSGSKLRLYKRGN